MIKALIYDIEIEKGIRPSDPTKIIEGIQYCDGWRDFDNMGISVICGYSYIDQNCKVWLGENLADFAEEYNKHSVVVGFNNYAFDDKLLSANGVNPYRLNPAGFDILRAAWQSLGLDPDNFVPATHGGLGLDAFAQANLGLRKTGTGENAAILWQQGQKSKVINYCLNDVKLTKLLFDKIVWSGYLYNPKNTEQKLWLKNYLPCFLRHEAMYFS